MSKKSLKVLHSAALLSPPSGIVNQMQWEQEAACRLGIEWVVKMYCPANSISSSNIVHFDELVRVDNFTNGLVKLFAWFALRWRYHRWLKTLQNDFDVFILRYYVHDPFQWWFVLRSSKPVYFVHHTLEVPELAMSQSFFAKIRSNLDLIIGRFTLPLAKGLIGVTKEIILFEQSRANIKDIPTYIYPNGIIYSSLKIEDRRKEPPELLFVANFASWHGLDLLLKTVRLSTEKFKLHLVGKIPQDLALLAKSDPRVFIHGMLSHDDIVILSQQCWIGLSSFALARIMMREACPLKVREYLMMGLPVYGNYKDTFDIESLFFRKGTENITEILNFSNEIRHLEKVQVSKMAKEYIDKKILLSQLYKFILKNSQKCDVPHEAK